MRAELEAQGVHAAVRLVGADAQVGYGLVPPGVYNSNKTGQVNNFMYSKMKGEFKYQNMETKIK